MKNTSPPSPAIDHQEQQRLAYLLWENANRPHGKDLDFWVGAERQLTAVSHAHQSPAPLLAKSARSASGRATNSKAPTSRGPAPMDARRKPAPRPGKTTPTARRSA